MLTAARRMRYRNHVRQRWASTYPQHVSIIGEMVQETMPDGRIVEGCNEQWVVVPRGWSDDKVIEIHHGGPLFMAWLAEQGLPYRRPTLIRGEIAVLLC